MPVNVTLEYEMNGPEGIADTIEQLKLPDDAEIDADGEVMTVREFKRLYAEYMAEHANENDIDRSL
jgi:hypothetical protein